MIESNPQRPLTVDWQGAADLTGIPVKTLRAMVKRAEFPRPTRYGARTVRFTVGSIEQWAARQTQLATA